MTGMTPFKSAVFGAVLLTAIAAFVGYRYKTVRDHITPWEWIGAHSTLMLALQQTPGLASELETPAQGGLVLVLRTQPHTDATARARALIAAESFPSWMRVDLQEVPQAPRLSEQRAVEIAEALARLVGRDPSSFTEKTANREPKMGRWSVSPSSATDGRADFNITVDDDPAKAGLLLKSFPKK